MTKKIEDQLNELANERAKLQVLELRELEEISAILTPELRTQTEAIKAHCACQAADTQTAIAGLEAAIKLAVVAHGKSVKGDFLMATWNKARETWDSSGLAGYAVAHPEIDAFRKTGKPSSTIRVIK